MTPPHLCWCVSPGDASAHPLCLSSTPFCLQTPHSADGQWPTPHLRCPVQVPGFAHGHIQRKKTPLAPQQHQPLPSSSRAELSHVATTNAVSPSAVVSASVPIAVEVHVLNQKSFKAVPTATLTSLTATGLPCRNERTESQSAHWGLDWGVSHMCTPSITCVTA